MTIGVFDSGVGGLSMANAIKNSLPEHEVILREDKANLPYGTKSPEELYRLVLPILHELVNQGCKVILIACNTVTTTIINRLRENLPVPLVGMEPMVKPAAEQTKSKIIAVCATPATLKSERYKWLKDTYAQDVKVLEPDCSDWALMIEFNQVDHQKIKDRINEVCESGADVIALGCTHYHWIEEDIQKIADQHNTVVIQPEKPVIEQLKVVISQQER